MSTNIILVLLSMGIAIFLIGVKDEKIELWIRVLSIVMVLPALFVWLCTLITGGSPYLLLIWCAVSVYYIIINTAY